LRFLSERYSLAAQGRYATLWMGYSYRHSSSDQLITQKLTGASNTLSIISQKQFKSDLKKERIKPTSAPLCIIKISFPLIQRASSSLPQPSSRSPRTLSIYSFLISLYHYLCSNYLSPYNCILNVRFGIPLNIKWFHWGLHLGWTRFELKTSHDFRGFNTWSYTWLSDSSLIGIFPESANRDQACKFVCLWKLLSVCLHLRSTMATVWYRPISWIILRPEGDNWAFTRIFRIEIDESRLSSLIVPVFLEWDGNRLKTLMIGMIGKESESGCETRR
jgi:hypothetical protein